MKRYLAILLISVLSVGLLACSQSKDQEMTSADKKSLSGNINTKDETSWSIDGKVDPSNNKNNKKSN